MKIVINDYISHQIIQIPALLSLSDEASHRDGMTEQGATHG
jgi:hypothetical protein